MGKRLVILIALSSLLNGSLSAADHLIQQGSKDTAIRTLNIDAELDAVWKKAKVTPAKMAPAMEWYRRVSLVIKGRPPNMDEILKLMEDKKMDRAAVCKEMI